MAVNTSLKIHGAGGESKAKGHTKQKRKFPTKTATAFFALAIALCAPCKAAGDRDAQSYLEAKDYAKALPLLQRAAGAGEADAMYALGVLYAKGEGIAQDYARAREWYQKAADAGQAGAESKVGQLQARRGSG
jgi:TPR repeat protein